MKTDIECALDALPAKVWTALPDGRIDFVNRGWSGYSGLGDCETGSWDWQALVNRDDLPELLERWQSILATGEPGDMEARMRRFDGQYRWHLIQCNPMRDDTGDIVKWCGVATDVDDLRQAEAALRRRELDFQSIVDSIPIPVAVTTPTGEVEGLNQLTLDYFGKTLEELKGWKVSEVVHPDDLERTVAAQLSAHRNGGSYNVESRHRRADGIYRWYNVLGMPLRDPQGQVLRWLHLLIDIEDRNRAEEILRESERNARLIVDSIPAGVGILSPTGEVEAVNKHLLDYFGRTEEEMKQWGTAGVVHPEDLPRVIETVVQSIATGHPHNTEQRLLGADGTYRWFYVSKLPLRDAHGRIVRWYALHIDIDERKRAEEALAASERNLQLIIDTIPALAWSGRPDGKDEFLSKHYVDYIGLSPEQVPGWDYTAALHPDDRQSLSAIWQSAVVRGVPAEAEGRLRRHDGEYRWFLFRANPLRDDKGNIIKWYGVSTDIDDMKRAQEALAASERNLQLTIDTVPTLAWAGRLDGTAEFLNQHYLRYTGLTAEEARDWGWTAVVHPDDMDGLAVAWQTIMASGDPGEAEARLRRHDGEYRWFLFRTNPLRDDHGNIVKWYGVNTDIEDRKRAEVALKRSEAFLAEGQYLARMGSLSWNVPSGEIIWSEQLYRIFEFEPGTAVTLDRIAGRVYPEDMPMMTDMVERAKRGESAFEYHHRIVLPDRSVKHLHLIAHRARDHPDQVEYIGAVLDVTQRRLSEEALEKLRSELAQVTRIMSLGVLTASIAHEVNQPLSGIVTNAGTCLRMLAADPPNIEIARETARRTIRDGNRAADVIGRLRALFSKRTATTEAVDLNEAVREVIALSSGDLRRNQVVLSAELANELPFVGGDRIQLQQVIMNLLRNAADAMSGVDDRPRRLLVRTEPDDDGQVRLSVQDAGVGFGPGGAARLFDAFYTTKSDGMGIGLSVSRSIIESHNGRLWAQANDGPGATFSFSIPEYSEGVTSVREAGAGRVPATSSSAQSAAGLP